MASDWTTSMNGAQCREHRWGPWTIYEWLDEGREVYLWLGDKRALRVGDNHRTVARAKRQARRMTATFERHF